MAIEPDTVIFVADCIHPAGIILVKCSVVIGAEVLEVFGNDAVEVVTPVIIGAG